MLLPGRRGHLIRLLRPALLAWLAAVLLAHGWLLAQLQDLGSGASDGPPPRLRVELSQPARPLPTATPTKPRRLRPLAPPQSQVQPLPPLDLPPAAEPLPPLPLRDLPLPEEPANETAHEPGPEWPLSTRLVYRVLGHYRGPVHGDAEVEWLRQGAAYQVRLQLGVGPRLAPYIARELVSAGRITPAGLSPQRYDEETRVWLNPTRRLALRVDQGLLHLAGGQALSAPPGLQDSASQFAQLAWLLQTGRVPLRAGQRIELPLALPRSLQRWQYEIVGPDAHDTPLGAATALWHLRPLPPLPPGALAAEVWLAPALNFLPLRLRISQGADTWLLLELADLPLQEHQNARSASDSRSP